MAFIVVPHLIGIDAVVSITKTPIHTPKVGAWGFRPINGEQYQRNPERHTASFKPPSVNICRQVWPVGEFLKKGINENFWLYFTRLPGSPSGRIFTKFCTGRAVGVSGGKFWWSVLGCGFCGEVKFCNFPLTAQSPLTQGYSTTKYEATAQPVIFHSFPLSLWTDLRQLSYLWKMVHRRRF